MSWDPCGNCSSSGNCPLCNGSGQQGREQCRGCKGSGNCWVCDGSGQLGE